MTSEDSFQFQYEMGDSVDFFGDPEGFFFMEDNLKLRNVQEQELTNNAKKAPKKVSSLIRSD